MPSAGGMYTNCSNGYLTTKQYLYRLVADILNDVATFLELLAPLFPTLFLYIVCVASLSKVHHIKIHSFLLQRLIFFVNFLACKQLLVLELPYV